MLYHTNQWNHSLSDFIWHNPSYTPQSNQCFGSICTAC